MTRLGFLIAVFLAGAARANDVFHLKNTYPRTATFQFYSNETGRWLDEELTLNFDEDQPYELSSTLPHVLQFHTRLGYAELLGEFDFHKLLEGQQGKLITLEELYVLEERIQTYTVTRYESREREEEYTVLIDVPETRTRVVIRRDPRTGRRYRTTEEYTVIRREPQTRTRTVTETIPVTEEVARSFTVRVRRPRLTVIEQGVKRDLDPTLPVAAQNGILVPVDDRRRYLGVHLRDTAHGPLVIRVDDQSPATRLRRLAAGDNRRYEMVPQQNIITEVNGHSVTNSNELIQRLGESAPLVVLTVRHRSSGVSEMYEARLEMH